MSLSDPLNILVAYPYLEKSGVKPLIENASKIRLLVDSGAFTAWKAGKQIALDDYCRFIEQLPITPWRYFTLDVVGDPGGTIRNYETMLRRGFKPVPIFTRGEDPSVLDDYYKTSDVVGIGGLVGTYKNRGFVNGIMRKVGGRKAHWLGFTRTEYLMHYRPYMADSSSWDASLRFGILKLYVGGGKMVSLTKRDFRSVPTPAVRKLIGEYGEDWMRMGRASEWVNTARLESAMERMMFRSAVRHNRDMSRMTGTKLFLACVQTQKVSFLIQAESFWEGQNAKN